MARVTHDLHQLAAEIDRGSRTVKRRVGQVLRKVGLDTERRWKQDCPVLTGRARASVGHWTPGDLRGANPEASAADAVWEESDEAVTIGSAIPYMEALNAGHSRQAPAGFIDLAAAAGEQALTAAVAAVVAQAALGR